MSGNIEPSLGDGILTLHWATSSLMRKRYETVDELGTSLRPIAFILATNRTFNIQGFCKSLHLSFEGSQLPKKMQQSRLMHLYLASSKPQEILLPDEYQNSLTLHSLPFDEAQSNNIGSSRKRQVELAAVACLDLNEPILIVLDDDLTFEALTIEDGHPIKSYPFSYVHEVYLFEKSHPCDVALGGVTGAPPLPATSCMKTFLQDFLNVKPTSNSTIERWNDPDYYYDLSETRSCWKTWPTLSANNESPSVQRALNQMFHSGPENRPLVYIPSKQIPQPRVVRGGNTVVFNPQYLFSINHPNLPRRGDSIWSILAKEQEASILEFPFPLYHTRTLDISITSMQKKPFIKSLKHRMNHDLLGAAMQRAMLDNSEILPFYIGRIGRQLRLNEECMELLCSAKQLIDDGSKTNGYWAMNTADQDAFVAIATTILCLLNDELKRKTDMADETSEKAMLLIKSMRYDAQKATEEA
tara:strand:- start:1277 stop:2686 length:1410 start_codon:yes stop_codon:yes gene_type:complete